MSPIPCRAWSNEQRVARRWSSGTTPCSPTTSDRCTRWLRCASTSRCGWLRELGVLDRLTLLPAPDASDELLMLVHDREYIDAVRAAGANPTTADPGFGLGTPDVPIFADMHDGLFADRRRHDRGGARRCWSGELRARGEPGRRSASRDARRWHRASASTTTSRSRSVGCSSQGVERVAYVDVDVHHGDGVEAAFWDDPRVLTISLHESAAHAVSRHRLAAGRRRPGRRGLRRQRCAPARHRRRRLVAGASTPSSRICCESFAPAGAGHPARLRQPLPGPAGPPRAERRRAAHRGERCCTSGRIATPADAGWPPAAAGTRSSTSSRAPGPT